MVMRIPHKKIKLIPAQQNLLDENNEINKEYIVEDNNENNNNNNDDNNNNDKESNEEKSIKQIVNENIITDEKQTKLLYNYIDTMVKLSVDSQVNKILENYFKNHKVRVSDSKEKESSIWNVPGNNSEKTLVNTNNNDTDDTNYSSEDELIRKYISENKNAADVLLNKEFTIANCLKKAIKKSDFTQSQVANIIGISERTLSNIVNNRYNTSLDVALKLSYLLNIPVNNLFTLEEIETEK